MLNPSDRVRFWSKVDQGSATECWPWKAAKLVNGGYGAFRLDGFTKRAHVIAFELYNGTTLSAGQCIMHLCNNPACCNPQHLYAGTQAENMQHKSLAGRAKGSPVNSKARLTEDQLLFIKTSNKSLRALGREFGVDHKTVARIKQAVNSGELVL